MKLYNNMTVTLISLGIVMCMYVLWGRWNSSGRPITNNVPALIVGTNAEYPPFTFIQDGAYVGFDIDLINAIAHHIGRKAIIKDMAFSALLPQLQLGTLQIIAAGLSPTPARAEHVLFTKPYLEGTPLVIVSPLHKSIRTVEALTGKDVIVNDGFVSDVYVSHIAGIRIQRLATVADAFTALRSNRADAFVTSKSSIQPFFALYSQADYSVVEIPHTQESVALAVSKKYHELVPLLQRALDELQMDGTIETLKRKWNLI